MVDNDEVRFGTIYSHNDIPDDERTGLLIQWCRRFDQLGLAPQTTGNLSFRTDRGFIITATGFRLGDIDIDSLVEVAGIEVESEQIMVSVNGGAVPSKESLLHAEIYHLRPGINAVFHIHDQVVIPNADEVGLTSTEGEQNRGSLELVREVNRLLCQVADVRYFVIRGHGIISLGETMEKAGRLVEDVNRFVAEYIQKKTKR